MDRETRNLIQSKQKRVMTSRDTPYSKDGDNGDIRIVQTTDGVGLYAKYNNKWYKTNFSETSAITEEAIRTSGYIPYTGANANVELGSYSIKTTGTGTFGSIVIDGVKKELDFNAGSLKAPGVDGAGWVSHGIKGAWEFANNKNEELVTAMNFPKDMDLSEAPTLRVCWSSHATSADAVWQLEYLFRQVDEDTTDVAEGTLTQIATSSATADGFTRTDFTGINVPHVDDKTMFIRLTRMSSNIADTLEDTAELHSIIFVYTSDKLGEAI